MRSRPLATAVLLVASLALTGCVPAVQGLARLNSDDSIDVVICGDFESTTLEFDYYLFDEWDGDPEWSATSTTEDLVGLKVLKFGVPPEGWTTDVFDPIPSRWDTFDLNFDISPGPSFDREDLRLNEWVQTEIGLFSQDRCQDARNLVS